MAALLRPGSASYHRRLACIAPNARMIDQVTVVTDEMAERRAKRPCGNCWNRNGYEPTRQPELWELPLRGYTG